MSTLSRFQRRPGLTLERAILVALVLHVAGLFLVDFWQPLFPDLSLEAAERPIEFRFVDTPESDPVAPPETEVLSDQDRRAADSSPRDDAADPFSEGNTPQPVLRSPEPAVPSVETAPVRPVPESSESAEAPEMESPVEEATTEAGAAEAATESATPPAIDAPPTQPTPESLPARPRDLRQSLSRLESFVDTQVFDNPAGGAQDSSGLAQFDTRGYDLGPYLRQVLRQIEANWRSNIPPLIRTGVGGATFVSLSIQRRQNPDGTESATIVARRTWASGQPAYDSAALFALELSSPLPPIPDHYPHQEITGRLGFIYNLDPASVPFPDGQ